MKKKGTIDPPSKKESLSDNGFERLKDDYLKAKRAYNEACYIKDQNARYEIMINNVSTELGVDKSLVDKAYQDDRRKLASTFAKYNSAKREVVDQFKTVVPYSAGLSAFTGLTACFVEQPAVFAFFSIYLAAWGALNATFGMRAKKELQEAHNEIKSKALDFQNHKRLPLAS